MTRLPTEPYKGVRDFYPRDMAVQNHIFKVWRSVVESFGYSEYNASILEPSELYREKSGEEIVNEQTYTFVDRGGRDVTLRPEMTPTVARLIAGAARDIPMPARWYSIPNVFRYERPQRGRLREHWQLNVDAFGMPGIEAELELIEIAYRIMIAFGVKPEAFEIKLNSRVALTSHFKAQGLSDEQIHKVCKLIDKKKKIDDFQGRLDEIAPNIDIDVSEPEVITGLVEALKARGITNASYDSNLMRGFDYYTDVVFEVFDRHPDNNRSLFGGGRYDGLTDLFGIADIPAVGFGMGDVTIRDVLETYGLIPEFTSTAVAHICVLSESERTEAEAIAHELRANGTSVSVDYSNRKIGDQIKYAERLAIPHVIVVGGDEVASGTFPIKRLATREETKVARADITNYFTSK